MRIIWQIILVKENEKMTITKLSSIIDEAFAIRLEEKLNERKFVHKRIGDKLPSSRQMEKWMDNGICPTPDGCKVEPDGTCPHGWDAWSKIMGLI